MPRTELKSILDRASNAFWAVIAEAFPEVTTGDFGPLETNAWENACEQAVKSWVRGNYPQPVLGQRYRLIRSVERYPHFTARAGLVGTIVGDPDDINLIRLRMDDHIAGAEEWDNEITWGIEEDWPDDLAAARAFFADAELVIETEGSVPIEEIRALLQYNWRDEEEDYAECGSPENKNSQTGHIFEHMQRIATWLDGVDASAPTYEVTMVLTGLTSGEVEGIDKRIAEAAHVEVKETHIGNILSTEG